MEPTTTERLDLRREIDAHEWYHTLELAPGIETPGWFDLREIVDRVGLPPSLAGRRCLDIGTFDGFWAFEMEQRGAAEVVAIDVLDPEQWDWPADVAEETVAALARRKAAGRGFELASTALSSSVRRLELSVHDLDPDRVGRFDLVYLGSLLLHLRDPIGALVAARSVCDGELIVVDAIEASLSIARRRPLATLEARGRPWWWRPNLAGLVRMVEAAGFELAAPPRRLSMPSGPGQSPPGLSLRQLLSQEGRRALATRFRGDPHAALRARPPAPGRS